VKDLTGKQHLMGGRRSLNEALNQALKLKDVEAAARPSARLQKVQDGTPTGTQSPQTKRHKSE
jgi:hypothetical protein